MHIHSGLCMFDCITWKRLILYSCICFVGIVFRHRVWFMQKLGMHAASPKGTRLHACAHIHVLVDVRARAHTHTHRGMQLWLLNVVTTGLLPVCASTYILVPYICLYLYTRSLPEFRSHLIKRLVMRVQKKLETLPTANIQWCSSLKKLMRRNLVVGFGRGGGCGPLN